MGWGPRPCVLRVSGPPAHLHLIRFLSLQPEGPQRVPCSRGLKLVVVAHPWCGHLPRAYMVGEVAILYLAPMSPLPLTLLMAQGWKGGAWSEGGCSLGGGSTSPHLSSCLWQLVRGGAPVLPRTSLWLFQRGLCSGEARSNQDRGPPSLGEGPPDLDSLPDLTVIPTESGDKSIQTRLELAGLYIETLFTG